MASITGMASDACVALCSGASILLAPRLTRLARAALGVAGIAWTCTALRVAGIRRTRAALRVASIARASAALRIACLTSGRARLLTAARITGTASGTLRPRARIALRPGTGIVARKPKVCAGDGDRGLGSPQLNVEVELVRSCSSIILS
jgi:hypothetical protein